MIPTITISGTAVDMALQGYHVFPLLKNGKTPSATSPAVRSPAGVIDAVKNGLQVRR